jgi:hypothetical protein
VCVEKVAKEEVAWLLVPLAISIPHQLVDINDDILTGANEQVALELVTNAKKALMAS